MPYSETAVFGVKIGTLIAGFAGGVVSLSFLSGLTTGQSLLAVFTGLASAAYITPVVIHYIFYTTPNLQVENGIAFVVGLSAMNIIPGIIKLSEMFKNNPMWFFRKNESEK